MKILITGAKGMLASDLIPCLAAENFELILTDKTQSEDQRIKALDVTQAHEVSEFVSFVNPDWIINCSAYTKVDDAEVNDQAAREVNTSAVEYLAQAAKLGGARFAQISTDYVFGSDIPYGAKHAPWKEDDLASPCGVYGKTKFLGEEAARMVLQEQALIIRTSWLHGVNGPNFIDTMLRVGADKQEVSVVSDQVGSPTYTGWLSVVIRDLILKNASGTFHASSRGDITWADFAEEIFKAAKMQTRVKRISTKELGRPAPRPAYSTFCLDKLEKYLGNTAISWKESVDLHLKRRECRP
ncbi:dTDP-4-dehydrorhamnose reductase [bacterium]|nr:dTDP-4-dehydrorhamnose reductase [bacterium]